MLLPMLGKARSKAHQIKCISNLREQHRLAMNYLSDYTDYLPPYIHPIPRFDAQGRQVFVLQVENFTIRNRITSLGTPTPIVPDYLTAAQVRSLIAAGIQLQFSENGTQWHDAQTDKDHFYRMRSASDENAAWSEAVTTPFSMGTASALTSESIPTTTCCP